MGAGVRTSQNSGFGRAAHTQKNISLRSKQMEEQAPGRSVPPPCGAHTPTARAHREGVWEAVGGCHALAEQVEQAGTQGHARGLVPLLGGQAGEQEGGVRACRLGASPALSSATPAAAAMADQQATTRPGPCSPPCSPGKRQRLRRSSDRAHLLRQAGVIGGAMPQLEQAFYHFEALQIHCEREGRREGGGGNNTTAGVSKQAGESENCFLATAITKVAPLLAGWRACTQALGWQAGKTGAAAPSPSHAPTPGGRWESIPQRFFSNSSPRREI